MKACPICNVHDCAHFRKFHYFNLVKIAVLQKSLDATIATFRVMSLILSNLEMETKFSLIEEDLFKCQIKLNDIRKWLEVKQFNGR